MEMKRERMHALEVMGVKMKKKYFVLLCLLDMAAIGLIPLNVLLLNFDMAESVGAVSAFIVIAASVLFLLKGNGGKITNAAACILALFSAAISLLGSYCNPYWNGIMFRADADYYSKAYDYWLDSDEAAEDLEYAMKYLKKLHPALYREVPEDIYKQYESVKAGLETCGGIRVNELAKEIETIFSILGDGHTYVRGNYEDRRIMKYYRRWTKEGYEITAVNGIPIKKLLEQTGAYYSFEEPSWQLEWLSDDIVTVAGLDYLGFDIEEGIEYTLTSEEGAERAETCYLEDFLAWNEYARFNDIMEDEAGGESSVDYEIDMERSTAILFLDECTYNSEYINCLREMFQEVKENNIENVAVDLRHNGGGSSQTVTEFFRYLDIDSYKTVSMGWRLGFIYLKLGRGVAENEKYDDLLFDGNLYLLTSAGTFSSAMMFAEYVKDNDLGTIIGEAPGNHPNGYGEVVYFKLPNSELFMQISTKRFYRADQECRDVLVSPDIECHSENAMEELYQLY